MNIEKRLVTLEFDITMANITSVINLIFFCPWFSFTNITIHRTAGKGEGYFFKSSLLLPPAS